MTPQTRGIKKKGRTVAWYMAFLCFWMATVGTIGHTDDLRAARSSSLAASWGHAGPPPVSGDGCAACRWAQAIQNSTIGACLFPLASIAPRPLSPVGRPVVILSRTPVRRLLRAPPVSQS